MPYMYTPEEFNSGSTSDLPLPFAFNQPILLSPSFTFSLFATQIFPGEFFDVKAVSCCFSV